MRGAAQPIASRVSVVLVALFAIVFSIDLYLFAATASLYDSYQPGISGFRMRFHPLGLLLVVAGGPLLLGLVSRAYRSVLARFSESISLVGGVLCVVALVSLLTLEAIGVRCDEPVPAVRELGATLRHALACPTFSGRSGAVAVYGGLLSALLFWGSRRLRRGT